MTDSEQLERILKSNSQRTAVIEELTSRQFSDKQELLDFALNRLVTLLDSKIGYIYYYDEETQVFTLYSWSNAVMANCGIIEPQTKYMLSKTGCWGDVVRINGPVIINDFPTSPHRKGYPEGHVPLNRFLGVPVRYNGHIVATAAVANAERDYTNFDVEQLLEFMNVVWSLAEYKDKEIQLIQANESLYHVQEIADIGGWEFHVKTGMFKGSPGAARIYGLESGLLSKEIVQDRVFRPDQRKQNDQALMDLIKGKEGYNRTFQIKRLNDGAIRGIHSIATYNPQTEIVMGVIQDETDWNDVVRYSKVSTEMYRNIVNNSPMGMHHYRLEEDDRLIFIDANPAADTMLGINHKLLFGKTIEEAFPGHRPETRSKLPQLYKDIAAGKLPLQIQQVTYKDEANHLDGIYDIYAFQTSQNMCTIKFLDVTNQVQEKNLLEQSLKEKEILLQEVHHRVKNNLQITISLLNLQSARFKDPDTIAAFNEAILRLQVMALSHQTLYQSKDFSNLDIKSFFMEIADSLSYMVTNGPIPIEYHLSSFSLSIDKAIPCGLVLNELLTNVLKHAYPGDPSQWKPKIIISALIMKDTMELSVEDNGIGIKTKSTAPGLGSTLIESLAHQLRGTIDYHRNGGTVAILKIPLTNEE